ncbi:MAG: SDR family NAD(P)-dependent oxidoreductase [Halioglobus sp.]
MSADFTISPEFTKRYGPWALIAGGSEGIGEEFAIQMAAVGMNIVLLARREQPLNKLAAKLRADHGVEVRTLAADLTGPDLLSRVDKVTSDIEVGMLLYNAGSTISYNRFTDWSIEELDFMMRLNCLAPVHLAHHFAQGMTERRKGGMMFLTSAAAFAGSAHMAIYPATKAFDHIFAEGLWHDLKPAGIDCLSLIVGATKTPSHKHVDFSKLNPAIKDGGAMACGDVAREGLAKLGHCSTWIVGEHNRARFPATFSEDRGKLIEGMSMATAMINDLPHVSALAP